MRSSEGCGDDLELGREVKKGLDDGNKIASSPACRFRPCAYRVPSPTARTGSSNLLSLRRVEGVRWRKPSMGMLKDTFASAEVKQVGGLKVDRKHHLLHLASCDMIRMPCRPAANALSIIMLALHLRGGARALRCSSQTRLV